MTEISEGLKTMYNNPGFWRGVLTVRQGDLHTAEADGLPSPATAWLGDAVQRSRTLFEAARTGEVDVTTLPEFERWHSPSGFVSKSTATVVDDLDIKEV